MFGPEEDVDRFHNLLHGSEVKTRTGPKIASGLATCRLSKGPDAH